MKTVIIEDEKAAVRNLSSLLNEVKPDSEIAGQYRFHYRMVRLSSDAGLGIHGYSPGGRLGF